ncbi:MAG: hypothetical protein ACQ9MH_07285 [Nitrospinales bacterium]
MHHKNFNAVHLQKLLMMIGLALGQGLFSFSAFVHDANAETVPPHFAFLARSLNDSLQKTLDSVPENSQHGKILKDSRALLKKAYVHKWSVKPFSAKPTPIKEELEKALDIPNLNLDEMKPFLAPRFFENKIAVIKALYDQRGKKLPKDIKFSEIAGKVEKVLAKRWEGLARSYTTEPTDHSQLSMDWDPQRNDFKILVEQKPHGEMEGFETTFHGDVETIYNHDTGTSEFSVKPTEDPIQPLNEEEKVSRDRVIEASIWGEWLSNTGDTWIFSNGSNKSNSPTSEKKKGKETKANDEAPSPAVNKARLEELKKQKLFIWKNTKTGKTVNQEKFKKLKDDDFEYQGQGYSPETSQAIKALEEKIANQGPEPKKLLVDQYDPTNIDEILGQGPLTITVTSKDGYTFSYDEAYHKGGIINAKRTLRHKSDITELPQEVIDQLLASWSPPEWIKIQVEFDSATTRLTMKVDRYRLHVTYSAGFFGSGPKTVKSIHTPYNIPYDLFRAEEFDPIDLRLLDKAGKEIEGELPYDQPVQVEVEFGDTQKTNERMVRFSWTGNGHGMQWVNVKAIDGDKKVFRSESMFFIPPDAGDTKEGEDEKLKL